MCVHKAGMCMPMNMNVYTHEYACIEPRVGAWNSPQSFSTLLSESVSLTEHGVCLPVQQAPRICLSLSLDLPSFLGLEL